MLYQLADRKPEFIGGGQFIAENATVIGSVALHDKSSIWFNVVIRGDNDPNSTTSPSALLDPLDHGAPTELAKRLAGQALGSHPRRDYNNKRRHVSSRWSLRGRPRPCHTIAQSDPRPA